MLKQGVQDGGNDQMHDMFAGFFGGGRGGTKRGKKMLFEIFSVFGGNCRLKNYFFVRT